MKVLQTLFVVSHFLQLKLWLTCAIDLRNLRFLDDDTPLPVLIGYKDGSSYSSGRLKLAAYRLRGEGDSTNNIDIQDSPALRRVNAAKAKLSRTQVQKLVDEDPDDVLYIEDDPLLFLYSEVTPWGIEAVQGMSTKYPPQPLSSSSNNPITASCSDPDSFKVGIIDSGLEVKHPDMPCINIGQSDTNCIGKSFGTSTGLAWDEPMDIHGTHVTGVMGATRGNGIGVTGVLNNGNVCFIMARVFGDSLEGALLSDILEGADWVADQGADVLNLSLGGTAYSLTAENFYNDLRSRNKLIFAASGNDGTDSISYPSGFDSVISVGAVDQSLNWAVFSQYNQYVDLVGPGQSILSTVPLGLGALAEIEIEGSTESYSTAPLIGSVVPSGDVSGVLVECPNLDGSSCSGDGGHICLIERGTYTFEEKALNCEKSGGIAAIIYNNEAGTFAGYLEEPVQVTIPVYSVSQEDGLDLLSNNVDQTITLITMDGYAVSDGTSFACPHAAAAAAAIWQSCRSCSNGDVEDCLLSTALDLGEEGRDNFYGKGLVQVEDAYLCLVDNGCCEMQPSSPVPPVPVPAPEEFPVPVPVPAPVPVPVPAPVPAPVLPPTTPTTGDCSTLESNYLQCIEEEFEDNLYDWSLCRSCIEGALPFFAWFVDCEKLEADVCAATREDCPCAPCSLPIEEFLICSLQVQLDCTVNCDSSADQKEPAVTTTTTTDDNNNSTNSFNNSSVIVTPMCIEEQSLMEECLAITTVAGLTSSSSTPQQVVECSVSCILGAAFPESAYGDIQPPPSSSSCEEINESTCRIPQKCLCSTSPQCSAQINDFLGCLVEFNTAGDCNLNCETPQPSTSFAAATSMKSVWHMFILVGISLGALIL